jgi:hypothetical protein
VLFSGVSSVSTMDVEGSGDKESVQITQQNIKESLHLLDVDAGTSRLGTIVLNYRNTTISGVSASRVNKFYSIIYQSNSIIYHSVFLKIKFTCCILKNSALTIYTSQLTWQYKVL